MIDQGLIQRTYTAVLEHFVATGRAPHYADLADALEIGMEEARELQRATVEASPIAGCWLAHDTDNIESWAPFSNVPTHYLVSVDGVQKWYGQCGMESLTLSWMFPGKDVVVESRCLDCGASIRVRSRDEEILEVDPETAVGYMPSPFASSRMGSGAFN